MAVQFFPDGLIVSLQAALDTADDGDTIFLKEGTYVIENPDIAGGPSLLVKRGNITLSAMGEVVLTVGSVGLAATNAPALDIRPDSPTGSLGGITIPGITVECLGDRGANAANTGFRVNRASGVLIDDCTAINFQARTVFDRRLTGSDPYDGEQERGNRAHRFTAIYCDDGIRFTAQDRVTISRLLEIDGQYLTTGSAGGPPHAIYAAGGEEGAAGGQDKPNDNVRARDCVSLNHRYTSAYKFRTGRVDAHRLHAQNTGSLVLCQNDVFGRFEDLKLDDWAEGLPDPHITPPATKGSDTGISIEDCKAIEFEGARLNARKNAGGLCGVHVYRSKPPEEATLTCPR